MTEKIRIDGTRFGDIEISCDAVIEFPETIPGFPDDKNFVLLDHDDEGTFKWLQSVANPDLAFLLTVPTLFKTDYSAARIKLPIESLGLKDVSEMAVLVMVCASADSGSMSLNLRAPMVFNLTTMKGVQYIIDSDDYPCDFSVSLPGRSEEKPVESAENHL